MLITREWTKYIYSPPSREIVHPNLIFSKGWLSLRNLSVSLRSFLACFWFSMVLARIFRGNFRSGGIFTLQGVISKFRWSLCYELDDRANSLAHVLLKGSCVLFSVLCLRAWAMSIFAEMHFPYLSMAPITRIRVVRGSVVVKNGHSCISLLNVCTCN